MPRCCVISRKPCRWTASSSRPIAPTSARFRTEGNETNRLMSPWWHSSWRIFFQAIQPSRSTRSAVSPPRTPNVSSKSLELPIPLPLRLREFPRITPFVRRSSRAEIVSGIEFFEGHARNGRWNTKLCRKLARLDDQRPLCLCMGGDFPVGTHYGTVVSEFGGQALDDLIRLLATA